MRNLGGCRGPWGYGGEGWVFFCQEYSRFPVNRSKWKAAQHLTLKLAALLFNKLNHSFLKCKFYLNLHEYIIFCMPKHHLRLLLFLPVNSFCHCNIPNRQTHARRHARAHAHTQNQNRMPHEKKLLKNVHILENVVNIYIINDLSYLPVTHPQKIRMHFCITRPKIINSARTASAHHYCVDINSITGL